MNAVEVKDLTVREDVSGRVLLTVPNLIVPAGARLVILGRTGAGKSLLARALAGERSAKTRLTGSVNVGGLGRKEGPRPFLVPQDGRAALDPTMRVGPQIAETIRWRGRAGESAAMLGDAVGLTARDLSKYPHALSGGMVQRALIAMALAVEAPLIIIDEPTTGLDPERSAAVTQLLRSLSRDDAALIVVSHDLSLAKCLATHIAVVDGGRVVEHGMAAQVLAEPRAVATKRIVAGDPSRWTERRSDRPRGDERLALGGVSASRGGRRLLCDVSLRVRAGEIVGLCGPTGIGKSTLADIALAVLAPDGGAVRWEGALPSSVKGRSLRPRYLKLSQDPAASFPPRLSLATVFDRLSPARHPRYARLDGRRRLLARLSLDEAMLARRPHELSGGELQRLALARAMLAHPLFLVCDEPSSQLDLVVQTDILDLVAEFARADGVAVLLISHDPAILRRYTHRSFQLLPGGRLGPVSERSELCSAPTSARVRA